MVKPIKQVAASSCLVTVLFGQTQDISSLLLEAHKKRYAGELLIPDNFDAQVEQVIINLQEHLDDVSSIHGLLRGMVE